MSLLSGKRFISTQTIVVALASVSLALTGIAWGSLPVGPGDTIADRVLGQPDFTHNNGNGVDAASLDQPGGVVVDSLGHLYLSDATNNRVLGWTSVTSLASGQAAAIILGQVDAFSNGCNNGGRNATSLCSPDGIAVDANNNLYVVDLSNNRVLEYNAPFASGFSTAQPANVVFGQAGSFTSGLCNFNGGVPSAQSLCAPDGVAVDSIGNVYITERSNFRVLEFNTPLNAGSGEPGAGDTKADMVFGQGGSFTSNVNNNGGVSATSLSTMDGAAVDSSGNLYVSDEGNNRVLEFTNPVSTHSITAHLVFGQNNSFTTNTCDGGGVTANSLCTPKDLNIDAAGNLYVADESNNRVLEFNTPLTTDTTADLVLGQSLLTGSTCNNPALGAATLCQPISVAHDSTGNIYVSDGANQRLLRYASPISGHEAATLVLGQADFTHNTVNGADASSMSAPGGVVVDSSGHLYVSDTSSNRILGFTSALSFSNGAPANIVIGQPDFSSTACNQNTTVSATTLCTPERLAVDASGNLYVADFSNNRVLQYTAPFSSGFTFNQPAHLEFGQLSFGSGSCNNGGVTQKSLCEPVGVAVDSSGNLYVGDFVNNRVLEYNAPLIGAQSAAKVIGQPIFTSSTCNSGGVSATSLCNPQGIALDSSGNLYVADESNSRILEYNAPLSTHLAASLVFGQSGSFTSNSCRINGITASSLCQPLDVAVDSANNLYAADNSNERVLEYNTPLISGTNANRVFGQGENFSSALCNTNGGPSAANLCNPNALALDSSADLFVADTSNNRVIQYESPLVSQTPTAPSFSPASLGFSSVAQNNLKTGSLLVTANGTGATNFFVPTISGANAADFTIATGNTCVGAINPAAKCTIKVSFKPTKPVGTIETATLNVNDDAGTGSQPITMTGTSASQTTVLPASLAFPATLHGTTSAAKNVTLANNQQSSLTVSASSITGTNAADFSVASTTCGATLNAFTSCTYSVTFHPAAALGAESATLKITDSPDTFSPHSVGMTGTSN